MLLEHRKHLHRIDADLDLGGQRVEQADRLGHRVRAGLEHVGHGVEVLVGEQAGHGLAEVRDGLLGLGVGQPRRQPVLSLMAQAQPTPSRLRAHPGRF